MHYNANASTVILWIFLFVNVALILYACYMAALAEFMPKLKMLRDQLYDEIADGKIPINEGQDWLEIVEMLIRDFKKNDSGYLFLVSSKIDDFRIDHGILKESMQPEMFRLYEYMKLTEKIMHVHYIASAIAPLSFIFYPAVLLFLYLRKEDLKMDYEPIVEKPKVTKRILRKI